MEDAGERVETGQESQQAKHVRKTDTAPWRISFTGEKGTDSGDGSRETNELPAGPLSPALSLEVLQGWPTAASSSRSGSMVRSQPSSGDSVFGEMRGRSRQRDALPVLGARNYSKVGRKVEKPPQRQDRSRKIDIDVMMLSTWRSQDVDGDAVLPRALPIRQKR